MQNRLAWVALAVGAYLAFMVARFPAATALRWLAPPEFAASGVSGTIWSGNATLASMPGLPMRELRWHIRGLSLLAGRLAGEFSARLADGFLDSQFSNSIGAVRLRQLRTSTSLTTLASALPMIRGTRGQLSLTLDDLVLVDGWPTSIVGLIRVSELEVEPFVGAGNQMIALGDYEVSFPETESPVLQATVRDTSGPLELNGTLSLYPNREYQMEGWLIPRADAQRELVQGLAIMLPEPDANGRRNFSFPGSL